MNEKSDPKVIQMFKSLGAATGALISRSKLGTLGGQTFGGNRKIYEKLGYKTVLGYADFEARFHREGIAKKVVTAFPSATWRDAPEIVADDEDFVEKFQELSLRLKLRYYLERADKISGIGQYGVLLIGTADGNDLDVPLTRVSGPDDILFLSVYSEANAAVERLVSDPSNPRFGMPEIYNITLSNGTAGVNGTLAKRVHHSRVIHLAEFLEEDEVYARPRLEPVWNYLDDVLKVIGGSSEAIWLTADRGIQFDLDKDSTLDPGDLEDFSDEIEEYMHGYRRYIRTQGITANVLGSDVADPSGSFSSVMSLISGSTGIPSRILLGSERGQLASSQDEKNFNGRVKERQENYAEPTILRPFLDKMIEIGALPETDYTINWPDPSTLTFKERADVAARFAQAVKNVATQVKGGQTVITPDEFRKKFLDLDELKSGDDVVEPGDDENEEGRIDEELNLPNPDKKHPPEEEDEEGK